MKPYPDVCIHHENGIWEPSPIKPKIVTSEFILILLCLSEFAKSYPENGVSLFTSNTVILDVVNRGEPVNSELAKELVPQLQRTLRRKRHSLKYMSKFELEKRIMIGLGNSGANADTVSASK